MAVNIRFSVRHLDVIQENAGELEVLLVLAVIMMESSFQEGAESYMEAQGFIQLLPATAEEIDSQMGMTNFSAEYVWYPEINIAMGSFYLNRLRNLYRCVELAFAAYNAGQGTVNRCL